MANKASRPGRTLIVFGLVIVAMYIGLAIHGVWKPKLGLDLQGGTRITLEATTPDGKPPSADKLKEAADIIDQRVNATGVSESEVSTQGNNTIVVEIPGVNAGKLVDSVKQTAQLRFRLVAASAANAGTVTPTPSPSGSPSASPSSGASPSASPSSSPKVSSSPTASGSPKGRAVSEGLVRAGKSTSPSATPTGKATSTPAPATKVPDDKSTVEEQLAWMRSPDAASLAAFQKFTCEQAGQQQDDPSKPLLACDKAGTSKYLLGPAIIEGTQLSDASYGIPQNASSYVVNLDFNGTATTTFADVTRSLVGTGELFAIVLDGTVLSAPQVDGAIVDGNAQITGSFSSAEAQSLATSLKYGALPLKFTAPSVTEEGPTLASDQLTAGLWAGAVGLLLVIVYCMLYYRGLGIVVVASLAVAGAVTYAAVLFLSENAGFTLTLPGIAGLIVAVGITADSFIVYFERIRDEMREGKSLRVAVEAGWARAKMTCLAADAVSLLAATVLYIFAIGVVKGFAFALGISTVIDLVVFFLFTKPMVTWLARYKFFSQGHKMSGLSPDHIGIERIGSARPAGGVAR